MTVLTDTTDKKYAGDGATTSFSTVFTFDANSEVKVSLSNDTTGVSVVWTEGTQYILTGEGTGNAGNVEVETSPTDYTPSSGETLVIELDPDFTQPVPLSRGGTVSPKGVLEPMHDLRVRQILAIKKDTDRSMKAPVVDTSPDLELPISSVRASKFLGFDSLGDIIVQTIAEIGAVVISDIVALVSGTASAGTSSEVSRVDHVHPSSKDVVESLTNKTMNDDSNFIHADAVHLKSRNVSGGPFVKGNVIYENAYNSGQDAIEILLADANDPAKMPALAIVDEGILNNANGSTVKVGKITGDATDNLDTTGGGEAWAVGDDLYVSTTPGALTNVRPTGKADGVQAIAVVLRVHATLGTIFVDGAGRTNDLPNSATAEAGFLGKSFDLGNLNSATTLHISDANIQYGTMTGSFTLTAPDDTDDGYCEVELTIDGTGAYTLTLSGFNEITGTIDTTANTVNILRISKLNTNTYIEITQAV